MKFLCWRVSVASNKADKKHSLRASDVIRNASYIVPFLNEMALRYTSVVPSAIGR